MLRKLEIGALVERRYFGHEQPRGMIESLTENGHRVRVIDPEAAPAGGPGARLFQDLDLVVARGRSAKLLSLLDRAEAAGIPTVNPCHAIAAVHNKAAMAASLSDARVPTPRTFAGSLPRLRKRLAGERYPVILKPVFGDNARGLRVVHDAEELAALAWNEPAAVAQEYVRNGGYDLKLYGIGDDVWAVRKPSPLDESHGVPRPAVRPARPATELVPLTSEHRRLARRCRDLFGLDLYGVDCIPTDRGCLVIEVNEFPNYSGVPGADKKLANYLVTHSLPRRTEQ